MAAVLSIVGCDDGRYFNAMPLIINTTILNGMGLTGALEGPPRFIPDVSGEILQVLHPIDPMVFMNCSFHSNGHVFYGHGQDI